MLGRGKCGVSFFFLYVGMLGGFVFLGFYLFYRVEKFVVFSSIGSRIISVCCRGIFWGFVRLVILLFLLLVYVWGGGLGIFL